jgi:hypothetical protein
VNLSWSVFKKIKAIRALHRMALIGTAVGSVPSPENQCNDGAPVPVFSKISDSFSRKGTHGTLPELVTQVYLSPSVRPVRRWPICETQEVRDMRCAKHSPVRNKIDLSDPSQLRVMKRRLGLSTGDLQRVVEKVANSISAVAKEIELERMPAENPLEAGPETTDRRSAGIIFSAI